MWVRTNAASKTAHATSVEIRLLAESVLTHILYILYILYPLYPPRCPPLLHTLRIIIMEPPHILRVSQVPLRIEVGNFYHSLEGDKCPRPLMGTWGGVQGIQNLPLSGVKTDAASRMANTTSVETHAGSVGFHLRAAKYIMYPLCPFRCPFLSRKVCPTSGFCSKTSAYVCECGHTNNSQQIIL
jgi:hypothetical protein